MSNYIKAVGEVSDNATPKSGPGICPKCGGTNLEYEAVELVDNDLYYPFDCPDCGAMGKEWYHCEWIESEVFGQ